MVSLDFEGPAWRFAVVSTKNVGYHTPYVNYVFSDEDIDSPRPTETLQILTPIGAGSQIDGVRVVPSVFFDMRKGKASARLLETHDRLLRCFTSIMKLRSHVEGLSRRTKLLEQGDDSK